MSLQPEQDYKTTRKFNLPRKQIKHLFIFNTANNLKINAQIHLKNEKKQALCRSLCYSVSETERWTN